MGKRKVKSDSELNVKKNKIENSSETVNGSNQQRTKDKLKNKVKNKKDYEKSLTTDGKQNYKRNIKNTTVKNGLTEKPNWLEFKKQKKELKEKYKAKRFSNINDIAIAAKQIGEKLRRSDCSELKRKKLILEAHDLLKNNYNRIILTHDMSRIVQWILKYCDENIQQSIYQELKTSLLFMMDSKYAKNCIKVLLKNGTKDIKHEIISTCYGNVVKFMSHTVSAPLLELMYSTYATDIQKTYIKQEFYGDMYKGAKDKNIKTLSDAFESAKDMKAATLSAVKGNLTRILNKKLLNSTLVHTVLLEYLSNCSMQDRVEIIVMLTSSIIELSQTKIGCKVAAMCIWHGTNKDRKIIMKCLKGNVKTVATSEHGYLILLALFDSVDDTVVLKKIILSEVENNLTDIALSDNGKHVILYLVARRNSCYFPPNIVQYLEQGDNNTTSKKTAAVREKELLASISDTFLESVAENISVWISNSSIAMVTLAILKVGTGDKLKKAFASLVEFITSVKAKIEERGTKYKLVEHAGVHMMLKKLIQYDKELQQKNETTFGEILVKHLETKVIERWIKCNRGCYLLVFLLENETISTVNILLSKLNVVIDVLKSEKTPGATVLLKKLK